MFNSQKWQVLLPLLMLPLFMLALLRTELRWRECASDEGRVCFNYPLYLPYEIRQQIDVHWSATLPAGILQLYPASISPEHNRARHLQWPRILITFLSCGMIWYLIGLWAQQLRNAKPLGPRQSGASRTFRKVRPWLRGIFAAVCVLAFLAWLAGNSTHGPNPSFGFMFGTLLPIYALRPTE